MDIYQRLTRERIIFMGNEIDDEMANQVVFWIYTYIYGFIRLHMYVETWIQQIIGVLLYLDNENPNQPIYLYINR